MRSENIGVKRGEGAVCLKGDTLILGASVGDSVFLCVFLSTAGWRMLGFPAAGGGGAAALPPAFPRNPRS